MKKREEIRAHFQLKHSLYFTLYADNEPIKCWNSRTRNPKRWTQKQKQYLKVNLDTK